MRDGWDRAGDAYRPPSAQWPISGRPSRYGGGVTDRLRALWDIDDLESTEKRLRARLGEEASGEGRAEVLTQLARVEGLRGAFDEGERLVEEAEALAREGGIARARIDLERGRLRRSSGNVEGSFPLFESAYALALEQGRSFVAADAAHMAALAAGGRDGFLAWTERGIQLAESQEGAAYWLGPLLNNLGWEYYEAGEYDEALDAFVRALEARRRDPGNPEAIALARYAVGKTLRALGRPEDAVPLLEQAVAWAEGDGKPDGWYHEELAEGYAALGREDDAREQARLAIPLLEAADPSFAANRARAARLHELARERI
jgi:tetratricopeptide (TPR) repeat protein